jgi:hypothetical protein
MTRLISVTTVLAAISLVRAQSADPGLGTNPNAQGATEDGSCPRFSLVIAQTVSTVAI